MNTIIDAICEALYTKFGASYLIYTEKVEMNLTPPCFLVRCLEESKNIHLGRRYGRSGTYTIQYFPSTSEKQSEMMTVADNLYDCLKNLTVSAKAIHGNNLSTQIVDDVLTLTVEYGIFEIENYTATNMSDITIETDAKG